MNYLSVNAMEHFLNSFDKTDHKELRCFCIVLLLYESGARVTELCNVRRYDLHLEKPYTMILHGKGDKIRSVPLDLQLLLHIPFDALHIQVLYLSEYSFV